MTWTYSSSSSTQDRPGNTVTNTVNNVPAVVTQILNDEALTSSSGNKNGLLDSMIDVRK